MVSLIIYFDNVSREYKEELLSHSNGFKLLFWKELSISQKEQALCEGDYFLVSTFELTEDILERATNIKLIQKTGIGLDNIDLKAAERLNIPVCNLPGGNARGVAELTIGMILSLYRKLNILDKATKSGEWLMWEHRLSSYEMFGKVHGFIGFGNIGQETAKRSKAFGTEIIYYDKFQLSPKLEKELESTFSPLQEVLERSDIISIHIPLLTETKHLISKSEFSQMKSNAILINVSRGNIVDEDALAEALSTNKIGGAGLDVWAEEPININNPLLAFDNIIATPHIGAGTRDTLNNVMTLAFNNFRKVEKGDRPSFIQNGVNL